MNRHRLITPFCLFGLISLCTALAQGAEATIGDLQIDAVGPYEVWAGNEPNPFSVGAANYWPFYFQIFNQSGYVDLGPGTTTGVFSGQYEFYVIGTRSSFVLNSISFTDGTVPDITLSASGTSSNPIVTTLSDPSNINTTIGLPDITSLTDLTGFVAVTNPTATGTPTTTTTGTGGCCGMADVMLVTLGAGLFCLARRW